MVNPELLNIEQFDLDLGPHDKIFAAQRKTHPEEGNTAEKKTVVYVS
jgi:hypothetical protein